MQICFFVLNQRTDDSRTTLTTLLVSLYKLNLTGTFDVCINTMKGSYGTQLLPTSCLLVTWQCSRCYNTSSEAHGVGGSKKKLHIFCFLCFGLMKAGFGLPKETGFVGLLANCALFSLIQMASNHNKGSRSKPASSCNCSRFNFWK